MSLTVQNLLKKINYIEAENEIQKQILVSIPSSDKKEIEKTIKIISKNKNEIEKLRDEIKTISPEEYEKLIRIESSIQEFHKLHAQSPFAQIDNLTSENDCVLTLKNGEAITCLVKASDKNGNKTIITIDGFLQTYTTLEVEEE